MQPADTRPGQQQQDHRHQRHRCLEPVDPKFGSRRNGPLLFRGGWCFLLALALLLPLLGAGGEPPEEQGGDGQVQQQEGSQSVDARLRGGVQGPADRLHFRRAGVEQLAAQRHAEQQGGASATGDSPAACSSGISTGPTVTAVLAWLTTGMLTRKPTSTVPGSSRGRTEQRPDQQPDQVLVAAALAQHVGKAHRRTDGQDELLVAQGLEQRPDDGGQLASAPRASTLPGSAPAGRRHGERWPGSPAPRCRHWRARSLSLSPSTDPRSYPMVAAPHLPGNNILKERLTSLRKRGEGQKTNRARSANFR